LWYVDLNEGGIFSAAGSRELLGVSRDNEPKNYEQFLQIVTPEDRPGVQAAHDAAIRGEKDLNVEFRINHPQRGERWLLSRGRRLDTAAGPAHPARIHGILIDITDRKIVESQRISANELLERAVARRTADLVTYQQQLRSLVLELGRTQQRERQQLANELHDNLVQLLAV